MFYSDNHSAAGEVKAEFEIRHCTADVGQQHEASLGDKPEELQKERGSLMRNGLKYWLGAALASLLLASCSTSTPPDVAVEPQGLNSADVEFQLSDGYGGLNLIKQAAWSKKWNVIAAANFGTTRFSDLFFYSSSEGRVAIYSTDGHGNTTLLTSTTGWGTTWSHVVIGEFVHNGGELWSPDDILFYDAVTGVAEIYKYYAGQPGKPRFFKRLNLGKNWSQIAVGQFGDLGHFKNGLFLYNASSGAAKLYFADYYGNLSLRRSYNSIGTNLQLVAGNFRSDERFYERDELITYNRSSGDLDTYRTEDNGDLKFLPIDYIISPSLTIIPGNFGGTDHTDLLLYNPSQGTAEFLRSDNAVGGYIPLKSHTWRKTWKIIPGNFGGFDHTDLLFYDNVSTGLYIPPPTCTLFC